MHGDDISFPELPFEAGIVAFWGAMPVTVPGLVTGLEGRMQNDDGSVRSI
jgi:hypothetical protein